MNLERICLHCMKEKPSKEEPCPYCGFDKRGYESVYEALPLGFVFSERFLIGTLKTQSKDAFIYDGYDLVKKEPVEIEEFFDVRFMVRGSDGESIRLSRKYKDEAKKTAEVFAGEKIEQGKVCIRENNTCYAICYGGAKGAKRKQRAWILPIAGVLLIIAVIFLWVQFSSFFLPKSDLPMEIEEEHMTEFPPETATQTLSEVSTESATQALSEVSTESATQTLSEASIETTTENITEVLNEAETSGSGSYEETTSPAEEQNQRADPGMTLMIYMVGSNLESDYAFASLDIDEMLNSGVDTEQNHVLIMAGGSEKWHHLTGAEISSDYTGIYHLDMKEKKVSLEYEDGLLNMGVPGTLSFFVNYCSDHYPSDHYGLILWDHGGGPLLGFGSDSIFKEDGVGAFLSMKDMRQAMDETIFVNQKLDLVLYDACLMQSLEMADLWSSYASCLLASQDVLPGSGMDYHALSVLNETSDPFLIANTFVDAFITREENRQKSEAERYSFHTEKTYTLSGIDLSKTEEVKKALSHFMEAVEADLEGGRIGNIARLRERCHAYALFEPKKRQYGYDLVDLFSLAETGRDIYPEEGQKLLEALQECVVFSKASMNGAMGLSLYFPFEGTYNYANRKKKGFLYEGDDWQIVNRVLARFMELRTDKESAADWSLETISSQEEGNMLQLAPEQMEDTLKVTYTLLLDWEDGTYTPVLSECLLEPDGEGRYVLAAQQELLSASYEEGMNVIVPVRQVTKEGSYERYQTQPIRLSKVEDTQGNTIFALDDEYVNFYADIYVDHVREEQGIIQYRRGEGGKDDISIEEIASWPSVGYSYEIYRPVEDENGTALPYDEWGDSWGQELRRVQNTGYLVVEGEMTENRSEAFGVQFIVEDIYGARHATEILPLLSSDVE